MGYIRLIKKFASLFLLVYTEREKTDIFSISLTIRMFQRERDKVRVGWRRSFHFHGPRTYCTLFYYSKLNRLTIFWIPITCFNGVSDRGGFRSPRVIGTTQVSWIYSRLEPRLDLTSSERIFFPKLYNYLIITNVPNCRSAKPSPSRTKAP